MSTNRLRTEAMTLVAEQLRAQAAVRLALLHLSRGPKTAAPIASTSTANLIRTILLEVVAPLERHPELLGAAVPRGRLVTAVAELRATCESLESAANDINIRVRRLAEVIGSVSRIPIVAASQFPSMLDFSAHYTQEWVAGQHVAAPIRDGGKPSKGCG